MKNELTCDRCFRHIRLSEVLVVNKKLVCPYCYHTIKTNMQKAQFIEKLQETIKKAEIKER